MGSVAAYVLKKYCRSPARSPTPWKVVVPAMPPAVRLWQRLLPWAVASVLLVALALLSFVHFREAPPAAPSETRLEITTPPTTDPASLAISPDGQKVVFAATSDGRSQLWLRSLDAVSSRPLVGTDGAAQPFWSPDSRSIGFFADSRLKRIDIAGGSAQTLANATTPRGGTWNSDTILCPRNVRFGCGSHRLSHGVCGCAAAAVRLVRPVWQGARESRRRV